MGDIFSSIVEGFWFSDPKDQQAEPVFTLRPGVGTPTQPGGPFVGGAPPRLVSHSVHRQPTRAARLRAAAKRKAKAAAKKQANPWKAADAAARKPRFQGNWTRGNECANTALDKEYDELLNGEDVEAAIEHRAQRKRDCCDNATEEMKGKPFFKRFCADKTQQNYRRVEQKLRQAEIERKFKQDLARSNKEAEQLLEEMRQARTVARHQKRMRK